LLLTKAATSILLLYFSLRWVNVGVLGERLSRVELGWVTLALFAAGGSDHTPRRAVAGNRYPMPRDAGLHFGVADHLHCNILQSGAVLDSWRGRRANLAVCATGRRLDKGDLSVLVDRIVGLVVLALIVIACLPYPFTLIDDSIARAVLLVIGLGTVVGAALVLLIGLQFGQFFNRWKFTRHLSSALNIVAAVSKSPRSATIVLACSVAIHLLTVAAAWCCVKAVAAPVSFAEVLFLIPPVILISSMPLSIAGWGSGKVVRSWPLHTQASPRAMDSSFRSSLVPLSA
jgi:hypothetical protein